VSEKATNLSEYITENFGANASYVEGLLNRYKSDPNLVDESWRNYFSDLMDGRALTKSGNGQAAVKPQTEIPKVKAKTTDRNKS
jgi:2-oxoglutarate dehydrogenase complex dehydrogenase (E1) component-like enzyme